MRVLMFLLFYGIVFFGESAMAADNDKRSRLATVGAQGQQQMQATQSQQEIEGRALVDRVLRGEIDFDEAMKQHRAKWYGGRPPDWNAAKPTPNLLRRPNQ